MTAFPTNVKVYTVNGAADGNSSSLPDWLVRKRATKGKSKRALKEHIESTLELIQGFEFPEASNRIKVSRDGTHVIATGVYKPQIRVWDLNQLSLKFERHTDSENVDFVMLSDDWTKSIHLQNDRTIELHTQGGFHYRTRIPRFGRSLAYHFPSCDALVSASGNEIYRLNLDQGRFMAPLTLESEGEEILGVNVIDVNPAHQLLSFGVEGNGTVQFWDPRSRSRVGLLRLPAGRLKPPGLASPGAEQTLSVTALASRPDGLSYAVGTSTGHTLLYDIRAAQPFGLKDQGYGLPIKTLSWIEGGSRMAGDGMVMSADKKVIKIWDRHSPATNFASITPALDLNDVHHIPGTGLFLTANEGIQMATYYIPQLGPAPRWASFLENITEEMEDQTTRNVYEDYKFVERNELKKLGLDHLIGTPALKPYMHGYFLSLKLYDTARLITNPFVYADHREKLVREKMDKLAETRIRSSKKDAVAGVKVNKGLAEKILKEEERAAQREERRRKKQGLPMESETPDLDVEMEDVENPEASASSSTADAKASKSLLNDSRFSAVFEDPDFEVDTTSKEYALLNPSSIGGHQNRGKTAVEEEDEESDNSMSSDGLGGSDHDDEAEEGGSDSDSSDEGELTHFDPRARPGQKNQRVAEVYAATRAKNRVAKSQVKMVPLNPHSARNRGVGGGQHETFGTRMQDSRSYLSKGKGKSREQTDEGGMEMSWVSTGGVVDGDESDGRKRKSGVRPKGRRVETFGAGMERGGDPDLDHDASSDNRKGRTQRRHGVRSGSKNVFRRM